ncbi:MAG: apolipoprotein N-acyltransferase [Arcobacter sp.]|nr:apolipoprotein N-acyltransferase [Arcobacter sp.]
MFLIKRDNFNKIYIIKGLITAIILSSFIFLKYYGIEYKSLNTILALIGMYLLIVVDKKVLFYIGFFTAIFWFYWIGLSFRYYDLIYLAPVFVICIGIIYGIIFRLFALIDNKIFRVLAIFGFTFLAPFNFNWMKLELLFINSYLKTSKLDFALILLALFIIASFKRMKILSFIPLALTYQMQTGMYIDNPKLKIDMPQFYIKQDLKWEQDYKNTLINKNLEEINEAIENKKDLIILPETSLPVVLNRDYTLLNKLKEKSLHINIIVGALYYENEQIYNTTYYINKAKVQIAKKLVLVPFGEKIPLPKFLVDLINNTFYNGAKDYASAKKPTDFEINGIKIRNAICYEATSDEIFKNLNGVKYMIATSNNAWFMPSTQATLQNLLLKYYSKKYDITIFHIVNGSKNGIFRP